MFYGSIESWKPIFFDWNIIFVANLHFWANLSWFCALTAESLYFISPEGNLSRKCHKKVLDGFNDRARGVENVENSYKRFEGGLEPKIRRFVSKNVKNGHF